MSAIELEARDDSGRSARELELSGCHLLPLHKNGQNVSFARGMEIGYLIRCRYRQTPTEAPMDGWKKRLIVVGDRVLVSPEEGEERTRVGLYLPPTAVDKREVQGGTDGAGRRTMEDRPGRGPLPAGGGPAG